MAYYAARRGDVIWGVGESPGLAIVMARRNFGTRADWTISEIDTSTKLQAWAKGGVLWEHDVRLLPVHSVVSERDQ